MKKPDPYAAIRQRISTHAARKTNCARRSKGTTRSTRQVPWFRPHFSQSVGSGPLSSVRALGASFDRDNYLFGGSGSARYAGSAVRQLSLLQRAASFARKFLRFG